MVDLTIRCSSISRLMTEPRSKSDGPLSIGAKTAIRELAAQALFGVDFEISGKELAKGIAVEQDGIDLLNRVRGLSLTKNTERRSNGFITGECDLFDAPRRRGHDIKCPWSLKTFPITAEDGEDKAYEWQCRGYMALWDADEWEVDYCMINTPENLIGYEPQAMHFVSHLPEHHRLTTVLYRRDLALEAAMAAKVVHAREYFAQVVAEFDHSHRSRP